jgi:uncharacterized protein (UPF0332 family)
VTVDVERLLGRAREELRAAEALLDAGFSSQAVSRAYLAAFDAASAALLSIGEQPLTRTGVVSAFGRRVVSEGKLDHEVGRNLRRLFDDRDYVDYALGEAPVEVARTAISDAGRLLGATSQWIESRAAAA